MAVSAAPAGPQKAAVQAWSDAYGSIEADLQLWVKRLADGQPPLKAGEAAKLRSLITSVQALTGLPPGVSGVAASVIQKSGVAVRAGLDATAAAVPQHAVSSAVAAAAAVGWENVPNPKAIQAVVSGQVGQLTGDFMKLSQQAQDGLLGALVQAVAAGESPALMAKRVLKAVDGTFSASQARALMISRTTLARTYDMASREVYTQAAADGLIKGWKWIAHGAAPCLVCQALDGTIFPADQDTYRHPNCRCTTVPVLMDEKGKVGNQYGSQFPDKGLSDVMLQTSKSGWTSWVEKPPELKSAAAAAKAAKAAEKAAVEQGAKFLGEVGGKWVAEAKGQQYVWSFGRGKWVSQASGKTAPWTERVAMNKAFKAQTGKVKPKAPPVNADKVGSAPGKASEAVVTQKAGQQAITGTYGGDPFTYDAVNNKWIHVPSGGSAGPNSTTALNAAMKAGRIEPPPPPGRPVFVQHGEPLQMTQQQIDSAITRARSDSPGSPYKGVTEGEWVQALIDASDAKAFPEGLRKQRGFATVVRGFKTYTGNYDKTGYRNATSQAWFKHAPMFARPTWRGVKFSTTDSKWAWVEQNPPGSLVDLRDGSSFSFTKYIAQGFRGNQNTGIMIEVRGGTSGLPVRSFSKFASEDEIIVNSQLRVVEVRDTPDGTYVICEEVGKYGGNY